MPLPNRRHEQTFIPSGSSGLLLLRCTRLPLHAFMFAHMPLPALDSEELRQGPGLCQRD
jgi:hypothetical protein